MAHTVKPPANRAGEDYRGDTGPLQHRQPVIDMLKEMGLREKYFVIIGGGPVNQTWADRIGADGYGRSAIDSAALVKGLIAGKK